MPGGLIRSGEHQSLLFLGFQDQINDHANTKDDGDCNDNDVNGIHDEFFQVCLSME
jgi:hypothetical protein